LQSVFETASKNTENYKRANDNKAHFKYVTRFLNHDIFAGNFKILYPIAAL